MRWIVLLRGVNVGGKAKVPMADLRALCEELGLTDVTTYIQSGNVVADGPRDLAPTTLERALDERFGVSARVVLRTPKDLRKLVEGHPFGSDTSDTHVVFLAEKPAAGAGDELATRDFDGERFVVAGRDVYVHYPNGLGRAKLSTALLERHLGAGTARNWRTVTKLLELSEQ